MKSQNTQSLTLSEIRQAVARGWCATENAHKVMDSDLAFAVANEVYEALRSTATAAQGEPVATKWAMYFSGEPENPQFKPGFMDNWCLYSDVLSVQHECDSANKSYAERDSATAGHKPYVARQVFVFANPPEPAGVVEAGTVGVSEARIDVDELWATRTPSRAAFGRPSRQAFCRRGFGRNSPHRRGCHPATLCQPGSGAGRVQVAER